MSQFSEFVFKIKIVIYTVRILFRTLFIRRSEKWLGSVVTLKPPGLNSKQKVEFSRLRVACNLHVIVWGRFTPRRRAAATCFRSARVAQQMCGNWNRPLPLPPPSQTWTLPQDNAPGEDPTCRNQAVRIGRLTSSISQGQNSILRGHEAFQ